MNRHALLLLASLVWFIPHVDAAADSPKAGKERIIFRTVAGDLVFKLYPGIAPKTVAQILSLVRAGAYDGTHFHRVEPGFVVQTTTVHDRLIPLSPQQTALLRPIPAEFSTLVHHRGVLSMARQDNDINSAESSFSILLGDAPHLDGKYTIFGEVESGVDVLTMLEESPRKSGSTPAVRLTIQKAEVADARALSKLTLAPSCHVSDGSARAPEAGQNEAAMTSGPFVPPTDKNVVVSDTAVGDGRVKTILFKDILIDKLYPSMLGPWTRAYVKLNTSAEESYIWITRYRAEVLDGATGKASQEFMCHTKLDVVGMPSAPASAQGVESQFVISQGQEEVRFPQGFALRLKEDGERRIDVNVMVLNNNYPTINRTLNFKATIGYLTEKTAQSKKLTPLYLTAVTGACLAEPATAWPKEPICKPAVLSGMPATGLQGEKRLGHWIVPPGRQVVRTPVALNVPYDTTVHYMLMHVHPTAEAMELYDLTARKSVWKGVATNDKKQTTLLSTQNFSSETGLPIYKDHSYEVVSTYNNRTGKDVDAMASLWVYLRDKSSAAPSNQY